MSGPRITDAAVEAGARAQWAEYWSDTEECSADQDSCPCESCGHYRKINAAIAEVKAQAWDEGYAEPRECCGLCPVDACPWEGDGQGPTNPYRKEASRDR